MVFGDSLTIHFAQDKPVFYGISTDSSRKNEIIYNLIGLGITPYYRIRAIYFISSSNFILLRAIDNSIRRQQQLSLLYLGRARHHSGYLYKVYKYLVSESDE